MPVPCIASEVLKLTFVCLVDIYSATAINLLGTEVRSDHSSARTGEGDERESSFNMASFFSSSLFKSRTQHHPGPLFR